MNPKDRKPGRGAAQGQRGRTKTSPPPLKLLPVNPGDPVVVGILARPTSPPFMGLALRLARAGETVLLVKGGAGIVTACGTCLSATPQTLRVLSKRKDGNRRAAILECEHCGSLTTGRPVDDIEGRPENGLLNLKDVF